MRHRTWALMPPAVLLSLVTAGAQAHPPPSSATLGVPLVQDTVTATVRSVHENGIEVITGVQFALRLTFIGVDSATVISSEGSRVTLPTLNPGDLVTVQYRETDEGMIAERIRVEPARQERGGP